MSTKNNRVFRTIIPIILVTFLFATACSITGNLPTHVSKTENLITSPFASPTQTTPVPISSTETRSAMESIQTGFNDIYDGILPSVVNIQVIQKVDPMTIPDTGSLPFPFPFQMPEGSGESTRTALGSGFVWDKEGHIITNNHVAENADQITVTFYDGTSVEGKVIGADRESDLAVIKVDYPKDLLQPIQLADSTQVQVGNLVAAIGNPFGLQGTMTVGIVSALGRSLPVGSNALQGSSYIIPDVIQTDAPINPGNSGGVLVNMEGMLVGVPTAIESSSGVNAGIGFVVPSVIVQKVVPVLIEKGVYEHPWIGISGTTITSDLAEAMDIARDQRGALVIDVMPNSPAEEAGLIGSDRLVTINDQDVRVGGDLITQIDSQPVQDFEDLTAFLARYAEGGQTVTLTMLRDGKEKTIDLTLGVRPNTSQSQDMTGELNQDNASLGIVGLTVSPPIAEAMNLPSDQNGVLIQQVLENSAADQAGLHGSYKSITVNGEQVLIGGDVIVGLDGKDIADLPDLQSRLSQYAPDDMIELKLIREGKQIKIDVTLGDRQ